jgi:hypothetical protein
MIKVVHHNVMCKECISLSGYITGWRHKCLNCVDYDLCEICFRYTTHNADHVFVTLKEKCALSPLELATPLLKDILYKKQNSPRSLLSETSAFDFKSSSSPFQTHFSSASSASLPNKNNGFSLFDFYPSMLSTSTVHKERPGESFSHLFKESNTCSNGMDI